jgi:hypothetical protein
MTHDQVVGSVVISLVVGLVLIVVGAVLQPLLKRLWERVNTPSPLTPQTRGQLMGQLVLWEAELERLNYLSANAKELFLRLIQLTVTALFLLIIACWLGVVRFLSILSPPLPPHDLLPIMALVVLTFAAVISLTAMLEAGKLSGKKIDATKKGIQKRIDEINKQLNPPDSAL